MCPQNPDQPEDLRCRHSVSGEHVGLGAKQTWLQTPTVGPSNLNEPQFPYLQTGILEAHSEMYYGDSVRNFPHGFFFLPDLRNVMYLQILFYLLMTKKFKHI